MDQQLLNWLILTLTGAMAWFLKSMWNQQHKLKDDVTQINILVVGEYAKRTDLERFALQITEQYKAILDKLDTKVDKP